MENKPRDFFEIADKIISVIERKCTFSEELTCHIIDQIEKCKNSARFRAPELGPLNWQCLADVLSHNFVPSNSLWETEIMVIFNDLSEKPEDYYEPMN